MKKSVTFSEKVPSGGDKSNGREWRRDNNIQQESTRRSIAAAELENPEREQMNTEAAKIAQEDASRKPLRSSKTFHTLAVYDSEPETPTFLEDDMEDLGLSMDDDENLLPTGVTVVSQETLSQKSSNILRRK